MQFLSSLTRIFFTILSFTVLMVWESAGANLLLKRTIVWREDTDVTYGDVKFPHFASFENSQLSAKLFWLPYWGEVIRLNANVANLRITIKPIAIGNFESQAPIQNQNMVMGKSNYDLSYQLGVEGGKSVVKVSLLPLEVTGSGKIEPLTAFELSVDYDIVGISPLEVLAKRAFASSSVLSQGDWYKVAVTKTGFHRLDRNFFLSNNIPIGTIDPRTIKIYGNGAGLLPQPNADPRLDDLVENAIWVSGESDGTFDVSDYVLFYAKSQSDVWKQNGNRLYREKNIYADTTYYFITFNQGNGKRIQKQASMPAENNTQNTHVYCYAHEAELLNVGKTGRQFLGEAFDKTPTQNFTFYIDGFLASEPIHLISRVAARSYITPSRFDVSVNGTYLFSHDNIGTVGTNYEANYFVDNGPSDQTFQSQTQQVALTYKYNTPPGGAIGWLDYFEINTNAAMTWYGSQVLYRVLPSAGVTRYTIAGAPATTRIFNVNKGTDIEELVTVQDGGNMAFAYATGTFTEFAGISGSTSFWVPQMVGKIGNQNLHGLPVVDAIYITPTAFYKEAIRLAAFHQQRGVSIHVINVNDIYNEFSSGAQDISAIRDFLRMFYVRGSGAAKLKYVTFWGRASYDYKYRISNNSNFVPTYQSVASQSPLTSYCSDDYFGFLDDGEGKWDGASDPKEFLDVAIGRLPVSDETEAANATDKIINYYKADHMGDWRNKIVFVADDEDGGLHQRDANIMANSVINRFKNYNVQKVWIDAYKEEVVAGGQRYPSAQKAIVDAVQKGCFIINYTGHGGELGWAAERILTIEDITSWTNTVRLPLFVTATCEFSRFDDPARKSAGELTFLSTQGGSIALFTTVRLVSAYSNTVLNTYFYNRVGLDSTSKSAPKPLGEIMRLTKNDYLLTDNNERNFTLLGDAVMMLAYPKYNVVTTSINNKPVIDVTDTLKALSKVTITGAVQNLSGQLLPFNGDVYPTVYDKPSTYQTLVNNTTSLPKLQFDMQNNIIYSGVASVVNGVFSFSFIVPKDIAYQVGRGKISYYTTNSVEDANGYNQNFLVGGTADSADTDVEGPQVRLYMDDEKFVYGGLTGESPLFIAKLFDAHGINTTGRGIGRELTLILDGDNTKSVVVSDYYKAKTNSYQEGEVRYPLKNITPGKHTITLKAWDTYNNASESTTEFVVASDEAMALEHVLNYPNPFNGNTTFHFDHNRAGESLTVSVQIFTISGKLTKTITSQVVASTSHFDQISWNGLDEYGDKLANGVYIYKIKVKSASGRSTEATQKLVILN